MIQKSVAVGLAEPQFIQAEDFRTIIYRPVVEQVTPEVRKLILIADAAKSRDELQEMLGLKDRENFRKLYINVALNLKLMEMTIPDKPNSKNQKYRLTAKGRALQEKLKKKK